MSAAEAAQAAALASYALEPAALSAHGSDDAAGSTTDVLGSTMPPSVYDVRYAWEAADVFLQEEDGRGATTVRMPHMHGGRPTCSTAPAARRWGAPRARHVSGAVKCREVGRPGAGVGDGVHCAHACRA